MSECVCGYLWSKPVAIIPHFVRLEMKFRFTVQRYGIHRQTYKLIPIYINMYIKSTLEFCIQAKLLWQ